MADITTSACPEKSLDDFFAKRDKKKKKDKGKGKEPAPMLGPVTLKKNKKEKEKTTKNENPDTQVEKEELPEEEWKEFEQKEVDYSGLRLQALQLNEEKEEEEYEKEEVGEDGEIILVSGDKMSGPWNKPGAAPVAAPPVAEVEAPEPKSAGVYRPPGARLGGSSKRTPTQGPLEISSDAQFPSLSSTAKHVETRRDREMEKTFEVVKHRSRAREEGGGASAQQLQLDNQYSILEDK